jgi:hypothetical protein
MFSRILWPNYAHAVAGGVALHVVPWNGAPLMRHVAPVVRLATVVAHFRMYRALMPKQGGW